MSEEAEIYAVASQRVGSLLHGKYHIDGVLGAGGMATVYAATHRNRKRFAVKVLHPEFSARKDLRARFVREGYVANSVAHPGVVAVLDDDVDDAGSPFLVMELLEGAPLDALYTTNGSLIAVREALSIICQLLEVLDAAHRKSVVHRDIKPANLFILRDGQVKVLDFGIAKLREVEGEITSTRAGAVLGTPAFMAPEQAGGLPETVDERTDIWGAGATLFTILTARFVHIGDNARQIMIHAATEPARSIVSILPDVPASVAALVSRALEFEPAQRWPSATAMRDAALEAYRALFDAEPVRADIAELVARTSARVETQPTEPGPITALNARAPLGRSLETTASTPVATRALATQKSRRWAAGALIFGVSALALSPLLHRSAPSARAPLPTSATAPVVLERAAPLTAAVVPRTPESLPSTIPSAAPLKRANVAAPRRPALTTPSTPAPVPVEPPAPENPLQLHLQ